jgi:hypothetical protein
MKRTVLIVGYIGLLVIVALQLVGCSPVLEVHAIQQQVIANPVVPATNEVSVLSETSGSTSCANPTSEMVLNCKVLTDRILASTVRVEFHGPNGGIGHGTVLGGRYLVTHNHYPFSVDALASGADSGVTAVSIYKANGEIILLKAPLTYFSVVVVEPELLVLDFQEYSGTGFFDSLNVPSAEAKAYDDQLLPGMEVAQIDWDGQIADVDWVLVTAVYSDGVTQRLELNNFVQQGASGGGIFYNGYHIANNWSRSTDRLATTGEIVRQYTVAAFNSPQVAAIGIP